MLRSEVITILNDLSANQLVNPESVIIDQIDSNVYQLKIKGAYDLQAMELFLKHRFTLKENEGFLIISNLEINDH